MGDRANVFVKQEQSGVYLYTHWSGTELPATLQAALNSPQGRGRWNDAAYLTRIIFCQMVKGDEDGGTGYGISVFTPDGEDRVLEVDPDLRRVDVRGRTGWTFDEFCNISGSELDQVWDGPEEEEDEDPAPAKKSKKSSSKKSKEDDAEDEEDEDEEEEEDKPKKSKKSAKKADADDEDADDSVPLKKKDKEKKKKTVGGPGVIASIVEFLKQGTAKKPMSKDKMCEMLAERFPDRSAESMMRTINVQVPNRLKADKGLTVIKTDKGYYIEE